MHRVFVGLTVLGLALGPLLGCAAATAGHPSAGAPPPPGRVLAQSIDDPVARHTAIRLGPLVFVDPQHGWLAADAGRVFRTTDGGTHWTSVALP